MAAITTKAPSPNGANQREDGVTDDCFGADPDGAECPPSAPARIAPLLAIREPDARDATSTEPHIEGVNLPSLLRFATFMALWLYASILTGAVVLGVVAGATGAAGSIESFVRELGFDGFRFASGPLLIGVALVILAFVVAVAGSVVVAGAVYNVIARSGGGIRVRVSLPLPPTDAVVLDAARSRDGDLLAGGNGDDGRERRALGALPDAG